MSTLKYILVELADGNGPKVARIFDTLAGRAKATREAILGPPNEANKNLQCPELLALSVDGEVHFEGDPGLQWIDANVEWWVLEELGHIDEVLARRPALADAPTRVSKIEKAINTAKQVDQLRAALQRIAGFRVHSEPGIGAVAMQDIALEALKGL